MCLSVVVLVNKFLEQDDGYWAPSSFKQVLEKVIFRWIKASSIIVQGNKDILLILSAFCLVFCAVFKEVEFVRGFVWLTSDKQCLYTSCIRMDKATSSPLSSSGRIFLVLACHPTLSPPFVVQCRCRLEPNASPPSLRTYVNICCTPPPPPGP